jgi:hypothetical protein
MYRCGLHQLEHIHLGRDGRKPQGVVARGRRHFLRSRAAAVPTIRLLRSILQQSVLLVSDRRWHRVASELLCQNQFGVLASPADLWRLYHQLSDYQALSFGEHGLPVYKLVFNAGNEIHGAPGSFFQLAPADTPTPDLARAMLGYWTSFTATLDPNSISYSNASRAVWPQYTGGNQTDFSVLAVYPTSFQVRSDSDANEKCDFLYGRSRVVYN